MGNKKITAFTLLELLIYISIFAAIAGLLTGILTTSLQVNQKELTADETTSQINFVLQNIQRLTRESSAIIANSSSTNVNSDSNTGADSTIGAPQSRLVLRMKDSGSSPSTDRDPLIITLASSTDQYNNSINTIVMYQGSGANRTSSTLTNTRVTVDQLQFTKYVQYPGHDTVALDLQISYNTNSPAKTTRNIHSAISRVSAATFDSNVLPGSAYTYSLGQNGSPWQNIYMSAGTAANPSYTFAGNTGLGIFAASSITQLAFSTAGLQRMVIDAGGNVGIGTTTPGSKLEIDSGGGIFVILQRTSVYTGNQWIDWRNASGTEIGYVGFSSSADERFSIANTQNSFINILTNGGERMRIDSAGNVGIGTVAPDNLLSVNGSADKPGGGSWGTFSDSRLKKNVKGFNLGLNVLNALNPVIYQYNGVKYKDDGKKYVGIIAQDLLDTPLEPYAISKSKDGYYEYDSSAVTYVLVNSIKEQQKEIENLKSIVCRDHPAEKICQ